METITSLLPLATLLLVGVFVWRWVKRDAWKRPPSFPSVPVHPVRDYRGPLAFVRRHYNGDYSLARAYWVNTFLLSLFAPLLGVTLVPLLAEHFAARWGSTAVLLVTALALAVWLWAVTGTWASANKHVSRGGQARWATIAKIVIVLGGLKTIGDIGNMLPRLSEHWRVARGEQAGTETKVEVRADGKSILLSGGINDDTAEKLEQALARVPAVTTVVLQSEGGWVRQGSRLGEVIRSRKLNTYVENYCVSACTIAFLAGKERAADPRAKIGFHSARGVGQLHANTGADTTGLLRIYRNAGLPETFIRKVAATPYESMWYPAYAEMLADGILTRMSAGGESSAIATSAKSKDGLAQGLKTVDAFAAFAERFPDDFEKMLDVAWARVEKGATDAEITSVARTYLLPSLYKVLPQASNETLVAYAALMLDEVTALNRISTAACSEMVFPTGNGLNAAAFLPNSLAQRELRLLATAMREADPARALKPTQKMLEAVAVKSLAGMPQDQVSAFVDPKRRSQNPDLTCQAAASFFRNINALPASDQAYSVRVLFASN